MRKNLNSKHYRVLAIALSTRGFGFAVTEENETFVDWGVKSVKGDKNGESLKKVRDLIDHYQPHVLVLEDCAIRHSRRSARIQTLTQLIVASTASQNLRVGLFSREQVMRVFFGDVRGTKSKLAEILGKRFAEELGPQVPPRRKAWMSEDSRMDIFAAVALGLVFNLSR